MVPNVPSVCARYVHQNHTPITQCHLADAVTEAQREKVTCPNSPLSQEEESGLELKTVSLPSALLHCAGFSKRTKAREAKGGTWGPIAVGGRSDHTGETFSILAALDMSPVLGWKQGLADTFTALGGILESGPSSQAGQQIPSSPDTPHPHSALGPLLPDP